jgi:hypothetical protein
MQLPWAHNVLLLQKMKDPAQRLWYMRQTLQYGWSRNILDLMIQSQAHRRQGKAITNFPARLPPAQSDLASQALKDPYVFDFLTLEQPFHERELETELLKHLEWETRRSSGGADAIEPGRGTKNPWFSAPGIFAPLACSKTLGEDAAQIGGGGVGLIAANHAACR